MDIEQEFEKFVEEDEAYGGTKKWKKGQNKMKKAGITLQKKDKFSGYVEEVEKEASTYRDKEKDDEKKRKFAFGGKKKSRHGASGYGKGEEVEKRWTGGKLPPHLAKFFDKDGNLKKDAAARVAKGREKINWIDVTPKGYGPKEEVEKQTKLKENTMNLKETILQVVVDKPKLEEHCGVCDEQGIGEDSDPDTPGTQGDEAEYQKKRKAVAKKFGVGDCSQLSGAKKKACYTALDKSHVADHEEQVELKLMKKEETQKAAHSKLFDLIKSSIQGK